MSQTIDALKAAYRKHHLGDDSIGSSELSDILQNALCNEIGDQGFQAWLASQHPASPDNEPIFKSGYHISAAW